MNATPTTLDANPFVKSLVFSNHPLYIYPCSPSDESSHSHVLKESSSVFPVHSCVSQGFSFSPNQVLMSVDLLVACIFFSLSL